MSDKTTPIVNVNLYVYHWNIDDENGIIFIYCMNEQNETAVIQVDDFTPYLYIELPDTIDWTESKWMSLANQFRQYSPVLTTFMMKEKLYGAHVQKKNDKYQRTLFPYLFMSFQTKEQLNKFTYILRRPVYVPALSQKVKLTPHEHNATPIVQLTSIRDLPTAGWIHVKNTTDIPYDHMDRNNRTKHEYHVSWKQLSPVTDPNVLCKSIKPKILSFDMEANSSNPNSMPNINKDSDKIFCIGCVMCYQGDTIDKYQRYILSLKKPDATRLQQDREDEQDNKEKSSDTNLITFKSEGDMIDGFADFIMEHDPQIIIGYNIFGWDIPYLIGRMKLTFAMNMYKHGYLTGQTAKTTVIKWSSSANRNQSFTYLDAFGRLYIDILPVIRSDYRFNNYRLNTIATELLGQGKDPLTPKGIFKCYQIGSPITMSIVCKYCVQDSYVTLRLFEHLQCWFGLTEKAKTWNVPILAVHTQGQQFKMFCQVYKYTLEHNIVVEKDAYKCDEDETYTGAIVIEPIPGMYYDVAPLDFNSLYPNTIIAYNLDYSTLVSDEKIPDEDCHVFDWEDHMGCCHDPEKKQSKTKKIICAKRHYRFLKEPKGVLPTLLTNLIQKRKDVKKELKGVEGKIKEYKKQAHLTEEERNILHALESLSIILDKRQLAYKISANSMYGATGVRRGYLPCMPVAMCTTAGGRASLKKAAKALTDQFNAELVYGDTDSCYVHFKGLTDSKEIWDRAIEVEAQVSRLFPPPMKIEFEQHIYKKFYILTKKRYMWQECGRDGILDEEIGKKGVMLARRDNSPCIRNIYKNMMLDIFHGLSKDEVLYNIVKGINEIYCHKFPLKDFVITKSVRENDEYKLRALHEDPVKREKQLRAKGVSSDEEYYAKSLPAVAQLAERMRQRGTPVPGGSRVEYIVTTMAGPKGKQYDKIEEYAYVQLHPTILKYDPNYYCKLLINPVDQVLTVSFKLDDFMKYHHKLRVIKYNCLEQLKQMFLSNVVIDE